MACFYSLFDTFPDIASPNAALACTFLDKRGYVPTMLKRVPNLNTWLLSDNGIGYFSSAWIPVDSQNYLFSLRVNL